MKFSVCTPVTYNRDHPDELRMPRYKMFLRCINSVLAQTFTDFEWVLADDTCNPPVEELLEEHALGIDYKVKRLPAKSGRLAARNAAMEQASGDWICWLDADDEYAPIYLEALNEAINVYPNYDVFNFNHLVFGYNYSTSVRSFIDMEKQGDTPFKSGHIGSGAFIFKRSVYDAIGSFPDGGLWDFTAKAFEEFPELKPFYWDEEKQSHHSLGNPWGDDFYYFYKMTRKFKSKYLNTALYFVHDRFGHKWPEDPGYQSEQGAKPTWDPNNQ